MVQEESRIAGADERITSWVSTHSEVTAAVDSQLTVHVAGIPLHVRLEQFDSVMVEDQARGVVERVEPFGDPGVEITFQATLVSVTERVGRGVRVGRAVLGEGLGADVDHHVGEGAGGDAATAGSGG